MRYSFLRPPWTVASSLLPQQTEIQLPPPGGRERARTSTSHSKLLRGPSLFLGPSDYSERVMRAVNERKMPPYPCRRGSSTEGFKLPKFLDLVQSVCSCSCVWGFAFAFAFALPQLLVVKITSPSPRLGFFLTRRFVFGSRKSGGDCSVREQN
jgi:hypothetical protein